MKTALWVLLIIALVVVIAGALNHETAIAFDYVAGSTPSVSLFWLSLGVAAALLLAGIAGWAVAVASAASTRRKLEKELEATYRRLRECEARLPQALSPPTLAATLVAPVAADEAPTAIAPAVADEAPTAVASAPSDESVTATTPTVADETSNAVAPAPLDEAPTAIASAPSDEAATIASAPDGDEPEGDSPPAP